MRLRLLLFLSALAVSSAGAAEATGSSCVGNASASPREAVARLLDALEVRDLERLRALTVSRAEFEAAIWPWLPVSRPGMNVTVDFAWGQYAMRNDAALRRLLENHVGEGYERVDLRLAPTPVDYAGFRLHEKPALVLRSRGGETQTVRLFGSIVEMNGLYKVYGFKND